MSSTCAIHESGVALIRDFGQITVAAILASCRSRRSSILTWTVKLKKEALSKRCPPLLLIPCSIPFEWGKIRP